MTPDFTNDELIRHEHQLSPLLHVLEVLYGCALFCLHELTATLEARNCQAVVKLCAKGVIAVIGQAINSTTITWYSPWCLT